MIRKINKEIDINEALQKLEDKEKERFEKVQEIRKKDFEEGEKYNQENDAGFYFSVVFNTRNERDEWLKEHNIVLTEDFFVKAKDFNL